MQVQFKVVIMEEDKIPVVLNRVIHIKILPRNPLQLLVLFLVLGCAFSIFSIQIIRVFDVYYTPITTVIRPSLLVPCNGKNMSNLDQRVNPPSDLMHNMNDEELFLRAISMPRLDCHRFNQNPKIAFMFLTKGGLPLSPLWERFFKGHKGQYSIYIHSLPSYRANFHSGSVFYKRNIPSQVTQWGRISISDAERRLLANALLDISNQWFVLLSESCIPLHNFTFIHNYISNSKYSFVSQFDRPGPDGRGRYNNSMSPVINVTQWRKGSQWFEVDRNLALLIVGDTKYYPIFAESCRPPCYVDEHYIPTMLSIEAGNLLANRSVTWVDWSRGGAHPGTFGGADITREFIQRVHGRTCSYNDQFSSFCYLFGRKFSPSALDALFLIAPTFLGY